MSFAAVDVIIVRMENRGIFAGKKAVVFDMDGTIIDSVGIWNEVDRVLISAIRTDGGEAEPEGEIRARREEKLRLYGKSPDPYRAYCACLKERYCARESAEEIYRMRCRLSREYLKDRISYKPGAPEFLRGLKARGFLLGIASATRRENMAVYRTENENIPGAANPDDFFSVILTREDAAEMKPSPEIYQKATVALGGPSSACLAFEDSLAGVQSAKGAGMEVAVVYDRYSDGERMEIEALSDAYFADFFGALDTLVKTLPL